MNSNLVVLSESPAVLYTQFFGLIILQFSKADETQPGEPQPGAVGRLRQSQNDFWGLWGWFHDALGGLMVKFWNAGEMWWLDSQTWWNMGDMSRISSGK